MSDALSDQPDGRASVNALLLEYLSLPGVTTWPGADALTVEEVLASYPEAVAAGRAPALDELIAWHPELTDELRAFFAAHASKAVKSCTTTESSLTSATEETSGGR
jgi:hypothetical protein